MTVSARPMKRSKARVTADLQDLLAFPSDVAAAEFDGPFVANVRAFLSRHARSQTHPAVPPAPLCPSHMLLWRVPFRAGAAAEVVDLDVVEEDVARSKSVYCDQCRVVGWSGHPVCGKRYHFIIRNDGNLTKQSREECLKCKSSADSSNRCFNCKFEMPCLNLEDPAYLQLDNSTHLLHGVVHTNGFGHLLRVNGREGGSRFLSGHDIMGFWDRICKALRVRKVSVMDISKKYGLEYRLLKSITTGRSWYGEWGYEFGAGSFALTAGAHQEAIDALSKMQLSLLFSQARTPRTKLQDVVAFYWSLSDHQLSTLRDLFRFIMDSIHRSLGKSKCEAPESRKQTEVDSSGVVRAWAEEDIKVVEEAMLTVLRAVGCDRWVTWRSLKGVVCHRASTPQLLDYCLKGLCGKCTADGLVVLTRCNTDSSSIEYRLGPASTHQHVTSHPVEPSLDHLIDDLKLLYDALLDPQTMYSYSPRATRDVAHKSALKILDCKQFTKNYDKSFLMDANPLLIRVWCEVELLDHPNDYTAPPAELLVLPKTATVGDLKVEATKAFQRTYLVFQRFRAEQLLDYGSVPDSMALTHLLGANTTVRVRGRCLGDRGRLCMFRMERGTENWTVNCVCGARDDDGERMMACDTCGVWQHTRCAGISDIDDVPKKFICSRCKAAKGSSLLRRPFKRCRETAATCNGGSCKDELASPTSSCLTSVGNDVMLTSRVLHF